MAICEEKVCLQVKPQTRRSRRSRSTHRVGPNDEDLRNEKVLEAKIYTLRRSGGKDLRVERNVHALFSMSFSSHRVFKIEFLVRHKHIGCEG